MSLTTDRLSRHSVGSLESFLQTEFEEQHLNEVRSDVSPAVSSVETGRAEGVKEHARGIRSARGSDLIGRALRLDAPSEASRRDLGSTPSTDFGTHITWKAGCSYVIEHRIWQGVFMLITFFALFSSDCDMLWGTEESKFQLSVVTTVVFGLFFIELVMQSFAKPGYICRAYFWLDLIALASLLPDTWFVQTLSSNNEFVAARSSKISRVIRVASRSSKATRLNRLIRIVRVAALMPRIAATCGRKKSNEIEGLLEKKLHTIFNYLDDDLDGFITQDVVAACLAKIKATHNHQGSGTFLKKAMTNHSVGSTPRTSNIHEVASVASAASTPRGAPSSAPSTPASGWQSRAWGMEEDDLVSFKEFKRVITQDSVANGRLVLACKQQVQRSSNMQNIASRHSEDVGVKVALGVLLLLLVLSFVDPTVQDRSDVLGLQMLDTQVKAHLDSWSGAAIPPAVQQHVALWRAGPGGRQGRGRKVLYLDIRYRVFCDELIPGANSCGSPPWAEMLWSPRRRMKDIDRELIDSHYRLPGDLVIIRLPTSVEEISGNLDDEALNRTVTSLAVLDGRSYVETEARVSLMTTGLVIVVILVGIVMLTKDMTYLSRSLLKPLRTLAAEMRAIVHLQLAGLSDEQQPVEHITAEINLIQKIFDNMKKAIKSWGKYVPWPVVQILLQTGVDAKTSVHQREVTMFFSDIAGFTSIVESLQPESSLLLLSKYFNDMSKVIDEHNGIVIEFIGDAILSVHGAPMKDTEHATSGVRATLRMLAALDKLNEWSAGKGLPEVKIRCGVHTGKVLIGNMGFHSRLKYGIVGENANIPGRLEELNKSYGTNMLISRSTYCRLKKGAFVVRPIDFVYLRSQPGDKCELVFQVLGREKHGKPHRLRGVAKLHMKAMVQYRRGQFDKAAVSFAQVDEQMQELAGVQSDPASILLMKRSLAYAEKPPREGWDGVWDQASEPT